MIQPAYGAAAASATCRHGGWPIRAAFHDSRRPRPPCIRPGISWQERFLLRCIGAECMPESYHDGKAIYRLALRRLFATIGADAMRPFTRGTMLAEDIAASRIAASNTRAYGFDTRDMQFTNFPSCRWTPGFDAAYQQISGGTRMSIGVAGAKCHSPRCTNAFYMIFLAAHRRFSGACAMPVKAATAGRLSATL